VAYTINGIKLFNGSEVDLSAISQAIAKDDTTVEIAMERPNNALLYSLAVIGIVPEHAHTASYGSNPVGSGRYMLEQWDRGQQVILRANPDYYGEPPLMRRVIVIFLEEDAALAAVRAGQADIANTSAVFSNQKVEGYELLACKSVDSRGISLPTQAPGKRMEQGGTSYPAGNPVTCDIAIRRALNHAIDRDLLVKNVLNGYGSVAFSVSDGMPWSSQDMRVTSSVDKARGILADGGWATGSDGILAKGGVRASFELCYPANDSLRQSLANEFANQARQVGIDVRVRGLSWDDIYPRQYVDPILWGWGSNSPMELYNLYHSKGSCNFARYESAAVDGYLDAALAAGTVAESFPLWQKAQWDGTWGVAPQCEATWVWLANIDHLYFKRDDLVVARQKLHPHGHGWSLANNVDQWSWR
jgi:peptide/nickel transport system substrate-binding protein